MLRYYQPSMPIHPKAAWAVPCGLLAAALLSGAYRAVFLATQPISFIVSATFVPFALLGCMAGLAKITTEVVRKGKIGSRMIAAPLGAVVGATALVSAHFVDFQILSEGWLAGLSAGDDQWFLNWSASTFREHLGLYHHRLGNDFTAGLWSSELLAFLLAPIAVAFGRASFPLCHTCGTWAGEELARLQFTSPVAGTLERLREAKDLHTLGMPIDMAPVGESTDCTAVIFEFKRCPNCPRMNTLTVSVLRTEVDGDGELRETRDELHSNIVLSPTEATEMLEALGKTDRDHDTSTAGKR